MQRTKNKDQGGFFDIPKDWEKHWQEMPEYNQIRYNECYCEVILRVRTKEDLDELSKLVGQSLSKKSKSIWYPKLKREVFTNKRYVDET
jgi:hypothetical protein